jgi:hypothetical protein
MIPDILQCVFDFIIKPNCHEVATLMIVNKTFLQALRTWPGWNDLCARAAKSEGLYTLRRLRNHGIPWDARTPAYAAEKGHFEMLEWAHHNGCPWDTRTTQAAARGGYIRILKWLHEKGCPMDSKVCAEAAKRGDLQILQWAREKECAWHKQTCRLAASWGHTHVLKWAILNGCTYDDIRVRKYITYDTRLLQWVDQRGYTNKKRKRE